MMVEGFFSGLVLFPNLLFAIRAVFYVRKLLLRLIQEEEDSDSQQWVMCPVSQIAYSHSTKDSHAQAPATLMLSKTNVRILFSSAFFTGMMLHMEVMCASTVNKAIPTLIHLFIALHWEVPTHTFLLLQIGKIFQITRIAGSPWLVVVTFQCISLLFV